MSVEPLKEYVGRIGDEQRFPEVAELEERLRAIRDRHPSTDLEVIGSARSGQSISCLVVGRGVVPGARHAVVTGTPHPNEPTGMLGALALAEILADDESLVRELGLVWHVVPCVDPDGAALNYGWYAGPYTRRHYAEHIYRPPFPEQYEWTFRRTGSDRPGLAPIPESSAVAAVIDAVRPELLVSMHNGEAGGLFAYVTRDVPGLREALHDVGDVAGLPIYHGVSEVEAPSLGPGLFELPDVGEMVSSTDYARQHGTLGVIIEPPMWVDADTSDDSPSELTSRQVQVAVSAAREDLLSRMRDWLAVVERHVDLDTTRGRAVREQVRHIGHVQQVLALDPASPEEPCTVAYQTSMREDVLLERLRATGHLVALLRAESDAGGLPAPVRAVYTEASDALAAWASERAEPEFVGLGPAVRAHVGVALAAAALLR